MSEMGHTNLYVPKEAYKLKKLALDLENSKECDADILAHCVRLAVHSMIAVLDKKHAQPSYAQSRFLSRCIAILRKLEPESIVPNEEEPPW